MLRNDVLQYIYAGLFSAAMVFGLYQIEVIASNEPGLSSLNVSLAASTLFLLGTVLLLGPLSRLFSVFDWALKYRKELGIMGFFTAFVHVYLVMFPLARNGPWGMYLSRPLSAYPGLEALMILFILFIISNTFSTRALGAKLWWQIQYWGVRVAFALTAFHMVVLKYKTIVAWLVPGGVTGEPNVVHYPPLIIWEAQFVLLIFLVRASELFGVKVARLMTQVSVFFVIGMMAWSMFLR